MRGNHAIGAAVVIAVFTAILLLPALRAPEMAYDSFWIDRTWSEQFTMLLRDGVLYPRWLPWSYGGLGAPVFYYYAPLSFYLAGIFGLIGLPTYPALLAAFATAWCASGITMHAWLKGRSAAPSFGALIYMVLPYHVIDFYGRGALAEFCAFALLPLVALGIDRAAHARQAWPLAFAYAALVMTHLPTAVIASMLLIAPLALRAALRDRAALLPLAGGIGGGVALAGIYLVPALTLQRHAALGSLWDAPFLQPVTWSLLHPRLWLSPSYVLLFGGLALTIAATAALLARGRPSFWPVWTIAIALIAAGLLPGFWSLPVLRAVQFPWRALALAEFGLATVVACRRGSPAVTVAILLPLLTFAGLMLSAANPLHGEDMRPLPIPGRQDVIEYLPAVAVGSGRAPRSAVLDRAIAAAARKPGSVFLYPSLVARCADGRIAPLVRDPATDLLAAPPPGCRTVVAPVLQERAGLALSLLALAAIVLTARRRWLRSACRASTEGLQAVRAARQDRPCPPPPAWRRALPTVRRAP